MESNKINEHRYSFSRPFLISFQTCLSFHARFFFPFGSIRWELKYTTQRLNYRITGLIWSEVKQLWDVGLQEYVHDMWNVIDFITNSLYVATVALRVVSYFQVSSQFNWVVFIYHSRVGRCWKLMKSLFEMKLSLETFGSFLI